MAALRAAERTWADAVSSNADLVRQRDAAVSAAAASAASYEAALRAAEHRANAAEHRASVAERAKATLAHEAETARQSLVAARRSLEAIVQSTSWRALAPLRSIGSRHPGLASAGRRAAKLVWWTATLQLGHRYLTRRQLRKSVALVSRPPSAPPPEEAVAVPEQPPFTAAPPAIRVVPETEPSMRRGDLLVACQALHRRTAIHFPPVAAPEVSIVIPVYKGLSDLRSCLRSIAATNTGDPSFEVILIDDCPEESVLQAVPDSGGLRKICNAQNMGFLLSCNKAAAAARGRIVCFLNSDTIVLPGWLSSLVDALDSTPGAAIAGGMLLNADDTIQDAGWRILGTGWGHPIGRGGDPGKGAYTYRRPADCVSGACLAVTKQALDELGGFDPAYAPAFYEEFDLAFRARKRGLLVIYEPKSRIIHLGSASYGPELRDQLSSINHATFVERFAEQMRKQPWDAADDFMLRHGVGHGSGPVLLVVDHAVPSPDRHAGDVTMTQYLSLLATAGWSVVFGPADGVAEGPAADALERQGIELIRSPQTIEDWLAEHGEHVSEVWLARPAIARRLIGPVRAFTRSRIAYYPHDLHHVRLDREAKVQGDAALLAEAASMRQEEIEILRAVDRVTAPCEEDGQAIRALAPLTPVTVMPPYFYDGSMILARDEARFEGLSDIVFVGGFPHTPNVDAAVFIAEEIMPLVWRSQPHARLMLVGYNPPPKVLALAGPRIVVTGQVPRTEPFMDRARLMLAALRYGAGVKGKVVEAMRLGVPVVTTSVGAEGIGIVPDRDALIGETAAELAQHVLDLFGSEQRCAELSVAGAELVRRRFSRRAARTAAGEAFRTPRCAVCGSGELIEPPPDSSARESFVCRNCFALGRTEALARVMLARLAPDGEGSLAERARRRPQRRVHEFGFVGGVADTLRGQPWFSTSEFFDDVERGASGPHGVRCEDLTRLTYEDESFDLVVSQDVMEHVPDPAAAFAETARVLRPGGSHVFTIPQNRDLAQSVVRARLDPYGVEYLLPPEYHGDPVRSQGALVFTDFGTDLVAILTEAGLTLVEHEVVVLGGRDDQVLRVFEGVKGELDLRAGPSSESRREAMLGDALGRMAVEGVRE
jgi:GT2 family glycosyltransferase/glycosyltransferase involved in cell wall biosynthesis